MESGSQQFLLQFPHRKRLGMPSDNWTNFMSGAHGGIGVIKHSNVPEGSAEQE